VMRGSDFGGFPDMIVKSLVVRGKRGHVFIICCLIE
jgi:hypothetical protein